MTDPRKNDAVLVTGATGTLGPYLCAELLRQTRATVYCLVRGTDQVRAQARLRARMRKAAAPDLESPRLRVVRGDLTEHRLGITPAEYDALAETTSAVYHCGASTNLAAGYDDIAPLNIGGTREVLGFARHRRTKTVHHVSSLGVFAEAHSAGHPEVDEQDIPSAPMAGSIDYSGTKITSELEVRQAATDLPVTIYRPGLILGDSRTGATDPGELFTRILRAAITVGLAPTTAAQAPVAPVDYVARALVALSQLPATGRTYHLIEPIPLIISDLFTHARNYGHRLDLCDTTSWRRALDDNQAHSAAATIISFWKSVHYLLDTPADYQAPHVHSRATRRALASLNIPCPTSDQAFFTRVFDHLTATRVLPAL
ncbi:thioester reductase domain-containing protein [Streptomyces sp. NBC_00503]|uniref:thioester reductase domain-containing protein n=1 Tax=Streptomyces sp. NBC_00503 TaxID=2903659 RepID=UPI002E822B23|nr:thioester reductase domain-containing protein [Streptomyces sp. NBC_00503]WUD79138.1 thioester reductase domain-containing protein [Streptomyces sp. NBC_00503]